MANKGTMKKARVPVSSDTETMVLIKSKRRCCLCFGINHDDTEKEGQVAHLNGDPSDNKEDNLAWLCQRHHSLKDSTTSQHKNYTIGEVKYYREQLHQHLLEEEKRSRDKRTWQAELERKNAEHQAEVMRRMMEDMADRSRKQAEDMAEYERKQDELQIETTKASRRRLLGE